MKRIFAGQGGLDAPTKGWSMEKGMEARDNVVSFRDNMVSFRDNMVSFIRVLGGRRAGLRLTTRLLLVLC